MTRILVNSLPCPTCGELFVPGGAWASHTRSCAAGGKTRRKRSRYRELFFAHNGPGPYACYFDCGRTVSFEEIIVHHDDGDHTNNDLANLVPCHRLCHNRHHFDELWATRKEELTAARAAAPRLPHTDEAKRKISETHKARGNQPSDEARELARQKNLGGTRKDSTKEKMSEYAKNRTPEHQAKLNASNTGRVVSEESRQRMSESAKARRARGRTEEVVPK